jgi:hypothetical protein
MPNRARASEQLQIALIARIPFVLSERRRRSMACGPDLSLLAAMAAGLPLPSREAPAIRAEE